MEVLEPLVVYSCSAGIKIDKTTEWQDVAIIAAAAAVLMVELNLFGISEREIQAKQTHGHKMWRENDAWLYEELQSHIQAKKQKAFEGVDCVYNMRKEEKVKLFERDRGGIERERERARERAELRNTAAERES